MRKRERVREGRKWERQREDGRERQRGGERWGRTERERDRYCILW